jgi:hypothetical protein
MESFLGKLKNAAGKAGSTASVAQDKILQEYLPKIIAIFRETAGPAIVEMLSDVDKLAELARSAYQVLPMPVRMVVKEQSFIDWVVSHQDSIVEKLTSQPVAESVVESDASALPPADAGNEGQTANHLDVNRSQGN